MNIFKGKPVEKQGRKAKGLRSERTDYDSRLPHFNARFRNDEADLQEMRIYSGSRSILM